MQKIKWQLLFSVILLILSILLYSLHYLIFQDAHHIFIFLLSDIAFIPIEVLLVSIVINRLLTLHEKKHVLEKLNMLIGVFFSELGRELCTIFASYDKNLSGINQSCLIRNDWLPNNFSDLQTKLLKHVPSIKVDKEQLQLLSKILLSKRQFLLNLIENPNLLEHETFTDLLLAIFHLIEELEHRHDFTKFPETDRRHLQGDIERAYKLLITEWIAYMRYLKNNYPYLFSLALRTNPFDKNASAVIMQ